jgi:hypothetical protein
MKQYIGITDFTSRGQVQSMLDVFKETFPLKNIDLMIGTMMSYKTLNNLPSRWSNIFPTPNQFRDIYYSKNEMLLNTLHYADYDGLTQPEDLSNEIIIAGHRGAFSSPTLDAVQLDMIWQINILGKQESSLIDVGKII